MKKTLNIEKYSIMGFCDGGKSALIMAIEYPLAVKKLVIWGAMAYITIDNIKVVIKYRDINNWNPRVKHRYEKVYDNETQSLWNDLVYNYSTTFISNGDICKDRVQRIQCPTLILHGDNDPIVSLSDVMYLNQMIPNSRLHRFSKGSHDIHCEYVQEFNELVQNYLTESKIN